MKENILRNGRPTIGVLVGSMSSTYQVGIMRGAAAAADQLDYNVIGFSGGPINSPDLLAQMREPIFDLADTSLLDAVVIPVSSHCRYLDKEGKQEFIDRFKGIPLINIGGVLPDCTNVIADYETGLAELIEHYVNDHGYKKIAFFRGPANHTSSNVREQIYKETLKRLGIEVDENLIVQIDFQVSSGVQGIEELFDKRGCTCDAAIAVNDNQALGLIEGLTERGYRVPEDIAVSGSMNKAVGVFSEPPLTTVEEPLFELGHSAIMALENHFAGKEMEHVIKIPTRMVIRYSCGCKGDQNKKSTDFELIKKDGTKTVEEKKDLIFKVVIDHVREIVKKYHNKIQIEELESLIMDYYEAGDLADFALLINMIKNNVEEVLKTDEILPWMEILTLFEYAGITMIELSEEYGQYTNFLETINIFKGEAFQKALMFQRTETDFYIDYSREIVKNLNNEFDLTSVRAHAIKLLDLTEMYISLYDHGDMTRVCNMMAVRNKELVDIPPAYEKYDAKDLLPQSVKAYDERYTLILFPLSFRKQPLGFLLVNLSDRTGSVFENMQAIISATIKNEIHIRELREAEERFSDIAHSTSDWLWETDEKLCFTYCSDSAYDIVGFGKNNLLGKRIDWIALEEWSSFYDSMKNQETIINRETWFKAENGNLVCLMLSCRPSYADKKFTGYRGVFKDITDRKLQEEKIRNMAYYDSLTGLLNRAKFHNELDRLLEIAKKDGTNLGVVFLDLDRFKYVNDTMGHDAGDRLLKIIAKRLQESEADADLVTRLGGDEFTVLIPELADEIHARMVADSIIETVSKAITIDDKQVFVTASIGIAMYPIDGIDRDSLLKNADIAMYRAKSRGRNQYAFYDSKIQEKNIARVRYEKVLRKAIIEGNFFLCYQPKVDCKSFEIVGFEALVRINDPEIGVVYPNNFIGLAEELGLIGEVDQRVFSEVCRQLKEWEMKGLDLVPISVNLSASQLKSKTFLKSYINTIKSLNIEASLIQLEITESTLIHYEKKALEILSELKAENIGIALDDFGTGYSSLSCVSTYPMDVIKLDRSFIQNMIHKGSSVPVIRAIIEMAKALNMTIVAEGVESMNEYNLLKELGCHAIQGYLFSKPVDVKQACIMLENKRLPLDLS